jgi:hypothetical protein
VIFVSLCTVCWLGAASVCSPPGELVASPLLLEPAWHQDGAIESEKSSDSAVPNASRFNWKGTLEQSGLLLGVQHSVRMVQGKTRKHLHGPFWPDYVHSVSGLSGWNDGNPIVTNYVGHPMLGAVTGYIQIQNDPRGIALEWNPRNPDYWRSRFKALGWATVYSTSFELAPWGEAGIGNVGYDRGTMGYVDLVVTPLAGLGMILLEDYLDKKVIKKIEQGKSPGQARFLRVILNPQRSIANLLRFERLSHRDTRPDPARESNAPRPTAESERSGDPGEAEEPASRDPS